MKASRGNLSVLLSISLVLCVSGCQIRRTNDLPAAASSPDALIDLEASLKDAPPLVRAEYAISVGDAQTAAPLARQALLENESKRSWWNYGGTVHDANQVLGRASLRKGDVEEAKRYLLAAGRTPGSPVLNSFGPDMYLAQELLERGETEAVLAYLDLVARFWAHTPQEKLRKWEKRDPETAKAFRENDRNHAALIAQWKDAIRRGEKPLLNGIRSRPE